MPVLVKLITLMALVVIRGVIFSKLLITVPRYVANSIHLVIDAAIILL